MSETLPATNAATQFLNWVKGLPGNIRQAFQALINKGGHTQAVLGEAAQKWAKSGTSVHNEDISEGELCTNMLTAQTAALNAAAPKRETVTYDPKVDTRTS
jgi:hypothetical protein